MLNFTKIIVVFSCSLSIFYATVAQQSPKIICIAGLVGAGKTTLATLLKEKMPDVDVMFEPAEKWLDVHGQGNLWDLFLNDSKRWALTTEMYVPFARIQALEQLAQKSCHPFMIVDRSIYEDRYVFARLAYEQGALSNLEWAMYQEWFAWIAEHTPKPHGFIYVHTSAEVTLTRMRERGRAEEKDFPLVLQQKFYQYYQDLFINEQTMPSEITDIPVLVLDGNKDFKNDTDVQKKCIDQIRKFMEQKSHPFDYDLKILELPAKTPHANVMVCLHGYGGSGRVIQKLRANRLIPDTLIGFNFPDANIVEGYDPNATTFGSIQELLPVIYVLKQTIDQKNLSAINLYGFSAGGGAVINLIAILNSSRYGTELESIGITHGDKQRILNALQKGHIILDCPLKSMDEIVDLLGHSHPLEVITQRYRHNNLRPIDSLSGWQGLAFNVFLYFATPDQIIFNRDDELFIQRLKHVNSTGKTTIIQADEGGHNTRHDALWQAIGNIDKR